MTRPVLPLLLMLAATACKPMPMDKTPVDAAAQPGMAAKPSIPFVQNSDNEASVMIDSGTTGLQLISSDTDDLGFRHIRYQQMFRGVPVWLSETIMHINTDDEIYRVDGDIVTIAESFDVSPTVSPEKAVSIAAESLGAGSWTSSSELLNIAVTENNPRLVWLIELKNGLNRKFVLIDAKNGETVKIMEGNWS